MTISQRLRTCAKHTGLDADRELLTEAADEIDRLSAGQPADVTDADIEQVLALAHSYADAKLMRCGALGIKEPPDPVAAFIELRRAILALRPVQVPMTDEEATAMIRETVRSNAILRDGSTALRVVRATEAHHDITAKGKKETP